MSREEMNEEIEFHDSMLQGIRMHGRDVTLILEVIVHVSAGRPGVDPGETYTQTAEVTISDGEVLSRSTIELLWILSGRICVDADVFEGLPVPFDRSGDVCVELSGGEGVLTIKGRRVRLELQGSRQHLDHFP